MLTRPTVLTDKQMADLINMLLTEGARLEAVAVKSAADEADLKAIARLAFRFVDSREFADLTHAGDVFFIAQLKSAWASPAAKRAQDSRV